MRQDAAAQQSSLEAGEWCGSGEEGGMAGRYCGSWRVCCLLVMESIDGVVMAMSIL